MMSLLPSGKSAFTLLLLLLHYHNSNNFVLVQSMLMGPVRRRRSSVAARDRRKKISDKTVELGKLIPGAVEGKMNTAEMLQHAFNYVLFMHSQPSLLHLSLPEEKLINKESLQIVGSSAVQEKLCMKDMCLVPLDLLDQLANNEDVESQGSISMDLKELIKSISQHKPMFSF